MLSTGMSQREVARQLSVHYNTIGSILKSDRVKRLLASTDPVAQADIAAKTEKVIHQQAVQTMTHMANVIEAKTEEVVKDLQQQFDEAAQPALNRLLELMEQAESEGVTLKAIESILDRSTKSPKRQLHQKHEVTHEVIKLRGSAAWMREIRTGMIEVGTDPESLPQILEEDVVVLIDKKTGGLWVSLAWHE